MKRISLFLSLRQIKKLKALSLSEGLSIAELVRRAIDDFLSALSMKHPGDKRMGNDNLVSHAGRE